MFGKRLSTLLWVILFFSVTFAFAKPAKVDAPDLRQQTVPTLPTNDVGMKARLAITDPVQLRFLYFSHQDNPFSPMNQDGRQDLDTLTIVFAAGPLLPRSSVRPVAYANPLDLINNYRTNRHVIVRFDCGISNPNGAPIRALHLDVEYTPPLNVVVLPMADGTMAPFARVTATIPWNGRDTAGSFVDDGVYPYAPTADLDSFTGDLQGTGNIAVLTPPGDYVLAEVGPPKATDPSQIVMPLARTITVDNTPPEITNGQPGDGAIITARRPVIDGTLSDNLSGLVADTVQVALDGVDRTAEAEISDSGYSFTPGADLDLGEHALTVTVEDLAGNQASATFHFTVASE
ncbi:MAG: hypothetical protein LAO51_10260 [Acidobacteriia bacterium]|nr:hypothetical protein [Terriglobia bacterium]